MQIALVVYDGVLGDECTAFRSVLERLPGAELLTVARSPGTVTGPGASVDVDATFAEVSHPDIVVVPGGLGCERLAADHDLRGWLHAVAPSSRWVVGSSTGSVVLAAAGLLDGRRAVTHWLATGLLERYGAHQTDQRLVVSGNVVTCEGRVSALDAAFTIVDRCAGPDTVAAIRHQLLEHDVPDTCPRRWYQRLRDGRRRPRHVHRSVTGAPHGSGEPADPPVVIELVAEPRGARRRQRRHRPDR